MNKQDLNGITLGHGIQWPDNKPIAVCLGIDFEAETLRISQLARRMSAIRAATVPTKESGAF